MNHHTSSIYVALARVSFALKDVFNVDKSSLPLKGSIFFLFLMLSLPSFRTFTVLF